MKSYLSDLGIGWDSASSFAILANKFDINKKRFYYLRQKLLSSGPLSEYLTSLVDKGTIVEYSSWEKDSPLPNTIYISTPTMTKFYNAFC